MKPHKIIFQAAAVDDLSDLRRQTFINVGPIAAEAFINRLVAFCNAFDIAPNRGTLQTDIQHDLRVVGFERSITVAFRVKDDRVEFLRFFAKGTNWAEEFNDDDQG
ncbi:MAG: type II toxin-antitoxin system RelE/ParE family toxin [Pseudomonadota bacterium]